MFETAPIFPSIWCDSWILHFLNEAEEYHKHGQEKFAELSKAFHFPALAVIDELFDM